MTIFKDIVIGAIIVLMFIAGAKLIAHKLDLNTENQSQIWVLK